MIDNRTIDDESIIYRHNKSFGDKTCLQRVVTIIYRKVSEMKL